MWNLMRLGRFPFLVQKFVSSKDILPTAAEDGTSRVRFWSDRDSERPDSFNTGSHYVIIYVFILL